jgi:hypothetical protein
VSLDLCLDSSDYRVLMTGKRVGVGVAGGFLARASLAASIVLVAALFFALSSVLNDRRASAGSGYHCLLSNQPVVDSAVAYKLRGSRCEGLYANLVDGEEGLWLVGFQTTSNSFDPKAESTIRIKVNGAAPAPLLLQVSSVAWRVHYGMDTDSLVDGGFDWSLDVFRSQAIGLGPEDIAAVACTNRCRRDGKTLFLPVDLRQTNGETHKTAATLILQARVELSGLFINVLHAGQRPVRNRPVGGNYMPAGRPIVVPVGDLQPGDNDVELSGVEKADVESRVSWRGHLLMPKQ